MKETTAEELKGKQVRIVSPGMYAYQATFTRLDTGEVLENVSRFEIAGEPGHIIRATLWLIRLDHEAKQAHEEAVVCENPELDLATSLLPQESVEEEMLPPDIGSYLVYQKVEE